MSSIRSFVAIPIPDNIKKCVQDWVEPFRQHDTSVRWVRPQAMHLTLKFLGQVEEERFEREFYPEFTQLSAPFEPIKLVVRGMGQFPPRGIPRVLWTGLEGDLEPLKKMAEAVDNFFERFGFAKEKRTFSPHLTLARIKQKPSSGFLKKWGEASPPSFGEFVADRVVFYRSELTKAGAIYSVLREFSLGGRQSA